jgi:Flp pilus assembly protein TadG
MLIRIRQAVRNNRGQSLVELALLLPVVLLLLGGIIDYGRLYNEQLIVTAAAREGARVAAVGGDGKAAAENYVKNASSYDNVVASPVLKSETVSTAQGPVTVKRVEMTVANPIPIVFSMIADIYGDTLDATGRLTVTGKAIMRME